MNLPCVRVQIESTVSYEYRGRCELPELLKVCDSKSVEVSPIVDRSASDAVTVNMITLTDEITSQQPSESFGWSLRSSKKKAAKRKAFGSVTLINKTSMADGDAVLMVDSSSSAINKLRKRSRLLASPSTVSSINTRSYTLLGRKCAVRSTELSSPLLTTVKKDKSAVPLPLRMSPRRCTSSNQDLQTGDFWRFLSTHVSVVCSNGCGSKQSSEVQLSPSVCDNEDVRQPYQSPKGQVHLQTIGITASETDSQISNPKAPSRSRKRSQRNKVLSGKPIAALPRSKKPVWSTPAKTTSQENCKLTVNTSHGAITVSQSLDREQIARDEVRQLRKRFRNDPLEYLSAGFGASSTVRRDQLTQVIASMERHRMARRAGILARLAFFERAGDRIATLRERDRSESSESPLYRQRSTSTSLNSSAHRLSANSTHKSGTSTSHLSRSANAWSGKVSKFPPAYAGSTFPVRDCFVSLCRVPLSVGTKHVRLARHDASNWRPDMACWHPSLNLEPLNLQPPKEVQLQTTPIMIQAPSQTSTLPSQAPSTPSSEATLAQTCVGLARGGRAYTQLPLSSRRVLVRSLHLV